MDATRIARAVSRLAKNRAAPGPLDGLPDHERPADEAEGYEIQAALARRLAETRLGPPVGVKIGCTTPVMQSYMKIASPCAGTIYRDGVHDTPATLPFNGFHRVGVECEIAVRLATDLPPPGNAIGLETIAACVESCMAAIEIVDDRYRDFRAIDTPTLIADDFFQAGCVFGSAVDRATAPDLAAISGRMAINGETVGTGRGSDILGHPLKALTWLAATGQARARNLGPGSLVMLGSVVKTVWVSAGDHVLVEIEELGRAEVRFT